MNDEEKRSKEIVEGWEKAMANYLPGEMSPEDKAAFTMMIAAEEASKERLKNFVLR